MGNAVSYSCYERWGKRTPDGPLFNFDPTKSQNGCLSHLIENFDYDEESKEGVPYHVPFQGNDIHAYATGGMNGGMTPNQLHMGYNTTDHNMNKMNMHKMNMNNENYQSLYHKTDNRNINNTLHMGMGDNSYNYMSNRIVNNNTNNMNTNNNSNNNTPDGVAGKTLRVSRRKPTYSPSTRRVEIESDDEEEDKLSTDNSDKKLSASDIKAQKIKQYRKTLTKVVKIKTAIFHETVKVTCSKDGKMLEWYKGKSDASGKKKPIGNIPLNKITSIRTKSDNPKHLEIAVNSVNISTYLFIFKTRDEREEWQSNLESFKKIMSMK